MFDIICGEDSSRTTEIANVVSKLKESNSKICYIGSRVPVSGSIQFRGTTKEERKKAFSIAERMDADVIVIDNVPRAEIQEYQKNNGIPVIIGYAS